MRDKLESPVAEAIRKAKSQEIDYISLDEQSRLIGRIHACKSIANTRLQRGDIESFKEEWEEIVTIIDKLFVSCVVMS